MEGSFQMKKPVIVVVASLKGGNRTTAERIVFHLSQLDEYSVSLFDTNSLSRSDFLSFKKENWKLGVGLHAIRAGSLLFGCGFPYCMVLGGTDVNEYSKDPCKKLEMEKVFQESKRVIAFDESQSRLFNEHWPHITHLTLIRPAVRVFLPSTQQQLLLQQQQSTQTTTPPSPSPSPSSLSPSPSPSSPPSPSSSPKQPLSPLSPLSSSSQCSLREKIGVEEDVRVILLVAGIRPVKDPLFLLPAFATPSLESRMVLVIIGDVLDQDYYEEEFLPSLSSLKNVFHLHSVSQEILHSFMWQSTMVINTSLSEGLPNAPLEAMALGVPVVARNIPGNSAVVRDKETGLLFDTPQEFLAKVDLLEKEKGLREKLLEGAREMVEKNFSFEGEGEGYRSVALDVLKDGN